MSRNEEEEEEELSIFLVTTFEKAISFVRVTFVREGMSGCEV